MRLVTPRRIGPGAALSGAVLLLLAQHLPGCGSRSALSLRVQQDDSGVGGDGGFAGSGGSGGTEAGGSAGSVSSDGGTQTVCYGCRDYLEGSALLPSLCSEGEAPTSLERAQALLDCACAGACSRQCGAFCETRGERRPSSRCLDCFDRECGPELDSCFGNAGASGGTGGVDGSGGAGTGGYAGEPVTGETCADRRVAQGTDPYIDGYEQGRVGGLPQNFGNRDGMWGGYYAYDDSTGVRTFEVTADGQSGQGLYYGLSNFTLWGGGWGLWFACVDVSVYEGFSFWVKGSEGSVLMVHFTNPHSMRVEDGGTCEGECFSPSFRARMTASYQHVKIRWSEVRAGSGGDFDPRVLLGIGFHLPNPTYGQPASAMATMDELSYFAE